MPGVAIEQMLELWCAELRQVTSIFDTLIWKDLLLQHVSGG
jgi:hypothetical protein